jgi:hypothetical protein
MRKHHPRDRAPRHIELSLAPAAAEEPMSSSGRQPRFSSFVTQVEACSLRFFATIFLGFMAPDFLDNKGFARCALQPSLLVSRFDPEPTSHCTQLFMVFDRMENSKLSLNSATHGIFLNYSNMAATEPIGLS